MSTIESNHPAPRVLAAIMAKPWAIMPEALAGIVEIANRQGDLEAVLAKRGQPLEGAQTMVVRNGVAILPITGPIFPRANLYTEISGATSVEMLSQDFQAAEDDPSVGATVLNIGSPGGQLSGIQEFAYQVANAKKPVVAYVRDVGASAAYWIAAAASKIVINKTAQVGSIGVVASFAKRGQDGTLEIVSSQSPKKRLDPASAEGRTEVQGVIDDLAAVFVADVAAYRGTTVKNVGQNFGQGGVLVGARAVSAGMADALGTLEGVIAELSANRPLAGNLNAQGEQNMPDAQMPDVGGGKTAATMPVNPNPTPVVPDPKASGPTAAGILALVGALHGPEVRASVEQAAQEAQAMDISCVAYAAMLTTMKARFAPAPEARTETPPAAPSGGQAMVQAITNALASPAKPGTVTAADSQPNFVAYTKAHVQAAKGGK